MAQYTVNYTCGCSEKINLFGKINDRLAKIARLEQTACAACRAKAALGDAEFAKLEGTPKQIAWAADVRKKAAAEIADAVESIISSLVNDWEWSNAPTEQEARQAVAETVAQMMGETSARVWIDNRSKDWADAVENAAADVAEILADERAAACV